MPLFLDQLIMLLHQEENSQAVDQSPVSTEMDISANRHGRELMWQGFTIDEVVRDYGDLCQEITGLAIERGIPIKVEEFRTLNRCLDNGIAEAVIEFTNQRVLLNPGTGTDILNERLGFLAHELRTHILTTMVAMRFIKSGKVSLDGAVGGVLDRSLVGMSNLIDRSLAEARVTAGMPPRHKLISLAKFISDLEISASLEAEIHERRLVVGSIDRTLAVDVDQDMLFSAVGNLLHNAFRFTAHGATIKLSAYAESDRILITIENSGHGLARGEEERGLLSFMQNGADESEAFIGLAGCRHNVELNKGILTVQNIPDSGWIFTIDLPRRSLTNSPR